jgi:hypothetical protein
MGLRFQKRITLLPGVHLNLSKSGVSFSFGGHGATINAGTQGQKTITLGIPGTGLSYKVPLTGGIFLIVLVLAALAGLVYLIAPDLIRPALHWWQPKIF